MDKVAFIKENNTNFIKTTLNDFKYIKSIVIFSAEESDSLMNLLKNAGYAIQERLIPQNPLQCLMIG